MTKISNQFASIEQVADQYLNQRSTDAAKSQGMSFEEILKQKQTQEAAESQELKFSKHATMRLADRNIRGTERAAGIRSAQGQGKGNSGITCDCGFTCVYCECAESDGSDSYRSGRFG